MQPGTNHCILTAGIQLSKNHSMDKFLGDQSNRCEEKFTVACQVSLLCRDVVEAEGSLPVGHAPRPDWVIAAHPAPLHQVRTSPCCIYCCCLQLSSCYIYCACMQLSSCWYGLCSPPHNAQAESTSSACAGHICKALGSKVSFHPGCCPYVKFLYKQFNTLRNASMPF